jgi:hypothetical protein
MGAYRCTTITTTPETDWTGLYQTNPNPDWVKKRTPSPCPGTLSRISGGSRSLVSVLPTVPCRRDRDYCAIREAFLLLNKSAVIIVLSSTNENVGEFRPCLAAETVISLHS